MYGVNVKVILKLQTEDIVLEVALDVYKSITLGRGDLSSPRIPDPLISNTHCKFSLFPTKLLITDLDSKNGSFLNGLRVDQADLFLGDEIKIGGTKITIMDEKMDPESVKVLTFLGAKKDRQSHGLQLDFTGARMINHGVALLPGNEVKPTLSANKEVEVRKIVQSKIRLSKQEIILKNKKKASLASTLDIIFMFIAVAIPLIASNLIVLWSPDIIQRHGLMFMFTFVFVIAGLYFIFNFKIMKFTTGEKLAGIEKLFDKQEI